LLVTTDSYVRKLTGCEACLTLDLLTTGLLLPVVPLDLDRDKLVRVACTEPSKMSVAVVQSPYGGIAAVFCTSDTWRERERLTAAKCTTAGLCCHILIQSKSEKWELDTKTMEL